MTITLVGGQASIQFSPSRMYFTGAGVKAFDASGASAANVVDLGGGWYRLSGAAGSSFRWSGNRQTESLRLEMLDARGRLLHSRNVPAGAGEGELALPLGLGADFVRLVDGREVHVRRIPRF